MKQKRVSFLAEEVRDGDGCLIKMRMTAAKKQSRGFFVRHDDLNYIFKGKIFSKIK